MRQDTKKARLLTSTKLEERNWKKSDWWNYVDKQLEKAIQNYKNIYPQSLGSHTEDDKIPLF